MIQNLTFGVYLSISDFLAIKSQNQQKLDSHQYSAQKHLAPFKNLNSLIIVENILLRYSQNPYSLYTFFSQNFSVQSKKELLCTISRRPKTTFSKQLESKCILTYISRRKFLFPRLKEAFIWWWLNNFVKAVRSLGQAKCFKIFHFN